MKILYSDDFVTMTREEDGFYIEYDNGEQGLERIFLGNSEGKAVYELQNRDEYDLIQYVIKDLNKMTFEKFINQCCVPDDYKWSGTLKGITTIRGKYGIAEVNITDDPAFEIKAEIDGGYIINWGGDNTLITDEIYQIAYIIVEVVSQEYFEAIPISIDFYYTKNEAIEELEKYIDEDIENMLDNFRVVKNEDSDTAYLISYSDAPYILEYFFDSKGWIAVWGLDENMIVKKALEEIDCDVLYDLIYNS